TSDPTSGLRRHRNSYRSTTERVTGEPASASRTEPARRGSAGGEPGPGDAQVIASAGDTAGVEFGHQREHELAAGGQGVTELGDGETLGCGSQQVSGDDRRGHDRVFVEVDPVANHDVAPADQLTEFALVDTVGLRRREPPAAQCLE